MKILVSNDDGVHAPGLQVLAEALKSFGDVTVVAPDRNRSAVSHALTIDKPLRIHEMPNGFFAVTGTPTDCVHLALTGFLKEKPDLVVSGINDGPNLGDDVLYSGTVSAAMEGRFLGFPTIAISQAAYDDPEHFDTSGLVIEEVMQKLLKNPLPSRLILNINVPDVPHANLQGTRVTRLGHRHYTEALIQETDPYGRPIYWVGPPGDARDAGEGTDFQAIREGYVSISPLQFDLTRHEDINLITDWLQ